jgi:hypothetical protein
MTPARAKWALLSILAIGGTSGGCSYRYADTLHPHYADFRVAKIGLVIWCSAYVAQDPAQAHLPRLDPRKGPMKKADKWDQALTPCISEQVQSSLRGLGYEIADVSGEVPFGPDVTTSDALTDLGARYPDLQAVLLVSYVVSPFSAMSLTPADDPMGSVSVNTETQRQTQTNYGSYSTVVTEYRGTSMARANAVGGTNLRGQLKLVHLATGEVLWEIGDHSVYCHYSPPGGRLSQEDASQAVCRQLATVFARPAAGRLGFPPKQAP